MARCIHGLREDLCAVCAERTVVARDRALAAADRLAEACVLPYSTPPAPPGDHMDWQECLRCGQISRQSAPSHQDGCELAAYLAAREETR